MARRPARRGRRPGRIPEKKRDPESPEKPRGPAPERSPKDPPKPARRTSRPRPADAGSDTSSPTSHVNAPESDVELYRDSMVGRTLGKCEIEKLIGEGKTAVVYRAQYRPLGRTVAVKLLQPHMARVPAVLRVFQQEGRAVAQLDHENILKIFDVGEDDGRHYLVLELLKGGDLLRVLEESEEGRLAPEDALDYVRQAAAGLAVAHRKGIIHRDIKPQNLVLEPDGTIKIVDFGLAAEAEGAYAGGRIGTPHYMSPEQCRGENAEPASDVYALGITLFHLVVGHPPYAGKPTTEEIIEAHLGARRLEPEKLVPELPRAVCELIRRMTRKEARTRPDARAVVEVIGKLSPERLRRGGGGSAVRARGKGKVTRRAARREQASQGPPTAAIAAIGLIALAGVLFLLFGTGGDDGGGAPAPAPAPGTDGSAARAAGGSGDERGGREPVDLQEQLESLLARAEYEEDTENWTEALFLYRQLISKAPADSPLRRQAREAVDLINKRFKGDGDEDAPGIERRRFVTNEQSEATGAAFDEAWPGMKEKLAWFQVGQVLPELGTMLENTREETPERRRIESAIRRAELIGKLLTLMEGRAQALPAEQARWSNIDFMASPALIIFAADARGLQLRNEDTGIDDLLYWPKLGFEYTLALVELLRNNQSAEEALMAGYFCQLHDDARADSYYGFAMQIDGSPEMRTRVRKLQEGL